VRADSLVERISRRHDRGAISMARAQGRAALPVLAPLVASEDPVAREIAAHCLRAIDDPGAREAVLPAVLDQDIAVRGAALWAIDVAPDAALVPWLFLAYDLSPHADVRGRIAIVLGRGAREVPIECLHLRCERETSPEAAAGLLEALARAGDAGARAEFGRLVAEARGRALDRLLRRCEEIAERWLLAPLAAVLADRTPLRYVGADGRPCKVWDMRACDIALNLIAKIGDAALGFETGGIANYTADQIESARRFADPQGPPKETSGA
jgi:hypothetical protein